jgi:hypothetical protein
MPARPPPIPKQRSGDLGDAQACDAAATPQGSPGIDVEITTPAGLKMVAELFLFDRAPSRRA